MRDSHASAHGCATLQASQQSANRYNEKSEQAPQPEETPSIHSITVHRQRVQPATGMLRQKASAANPTARRF